MNIKLLSIIVTFVLLGMTVVAMDTDSVTDSERLLLETQAQKLKPRIDAKQQELVAVMGQLRLKMEEFKLAVGTYQVKEGAKLAALDKNLSKNDLGAIEKEVRRAASEVEKIKFEVEKLQDRVSSLNIIVLQPLFDEYFTILIKLGKIDQVREALAQLDDKMYAELKGKMFYQMGAAWVAWVYGKNTKVGFEIVNTSDAPVWVSLRSGDRLILDNQKVDGRGWLSYGRLSAEIDIYDSSNQLLVYMQDATRPGAAPTVYQFKPGKTIYVSWNGNTLVPQQDGLIQKKTNVTSSGYSLQFNVTAQDIMRGQLVKKMANINKSHEAKIKNTVILAQLKESLVWQHSINRYMKIHNHDAQQLSLVSTIMDGH